MCPKTVVVAKLKAIDTLTRVATTATPVVRDLAGTLTTSENTPAKKLVDLMRKKKKVNMFEMDLISYEGDGTTLHDQRMRKSTVVGIVIRFDQN
mmetsp:Transcript_26249/g.75714  ORF Transcript_26249/g.75714 Transcript_26249/m.75714 type:complete len:94 (+) Transcript_26249:1148-1429(+)